MLKMDVKPPLDIQVMFRNGSSLLIENVITVQTINSNHPDLIYTMYTTKDGAYHTVYDSAIAYMYSKKHEE